MIHLKKLLHGRFQSNGLADLSDSLYSSEQMRRILDRERMRSDRGNSIFSLLTFTFPTSCDAAELAVMANVFRRQLRATDDAGLFDPHRLGVVLPETPAEGAWKLADDVCQVLPRATRRPECDVYTYPMQIEPHEAATNGAASKGAAMNRARTNDAVKNGAPTSGVVAHKAERRAQSMRALFVQRLPAWKRAIDVVGAGTALVLAAPLLLLTAVIIKLSSRGPVLYTQQRDGHAGRKFRIYKFRTMVINAEAMKSQLHSMNEQDGPAFKMKNDPRVTPFGRLLRRTCLDELPQLFNVLIGDMSLVGPRPMCSKEARHCRQWQRRRLDVTPGLTCTWQIQGGTKATFTEWMRMDLRYIGSRTLWKDLRLMAMTIPSIIRRDGVY